MYNGAITIQIEYMTTALFHLNTPIATGTSLKIGLSTLRDGNKGVFLFGIYNDVKAGRLKSTSRDLLKLMNSMKAN